MVRGIHELSPVRRLTKGYGNQSADGEHMVDLIDAANGHIVARCVFERYADEIIWAIDAALAEHQS